MVLISLLEYMEANNRPKYNSVVSIAQLVMKLEAISVCNLLENN